LLKDNDTSREEQTSSQRTRQKYKEERQKALEKLKLDRRHKSEKIGNVNDFDSYMIIVKSKMAEKRNSAQRQNESPTKMFPKGSAKVLSESGAHKRNPLADAVNKKINKD
jgi:hypothetical protein